MLHRQISAELMHRNLWTKWRFLSLTLTATLLPAWSAPCVCYQCIVSPILKLMLSFMLQYSHKHREPLTHKLKYSKKGRSLPPSVMKKREPCWCVLLSVCTFCIDCDVYHIYYLYVPEKITVMYTDTICLLSSCHKFAPHSNFIPITLTV